MSQIDRTRRALNILTKWRVLLTGWQLGTRAKGDPEGDAVRDHREATLVLRAEVSNLNHLLIGKGVFTHEEYLAGLETAAKQLDEDLATRFPGVTASESGLHIDTTRATAWMGNWKP